MSGYPDPGPYQSGQHRQQQPRGPYIPFHKRKGFWIFTGIIFGAGVLLLAVGVAGGNSGGTGTSGGGSAAEAVAAPPTCGLDEHAVSNGCATDAAPSPPPSPSAPPVTETRSKDYVVFRVWGYAPDGADITYGNDSSNLSPPGGLGFDGEGTALPWRGQLRYHGSALYYDVSAQLQGGGSITCALYVKVVDYYSDGTHTSDSKRVVTGHAAGGYNICDAQSS